MRAQLRYLLDLIRNSFWFIPGLILIAAVALSVGMVRIDRRFPIDPARDPDWVRHLVYTGGPDGAREVLSTIAGSMITVAGVVFSITIVALTLASSQFGPRLLSSFMRDRGNQVVLGVFIATFVYSLLVLRTIETGNGPAPDRVPHYSVTGGILLAIASLWVLIYFIHHVSISIQAHHLVASIARELRGSVDGLFPQAGAAHEHPEASERELLPEPFEEEAASIHASSSGYIEALDLNAILEEAARRGAVIRMEYRPGHFVVRGSTLARIFPAEKADRKLTRRLARAVVTGPRRTAIQDVEFPINQLVEIAVRALSPSLNDPFTAINCIDHLAAELCDLASREFPSRFRVGEDGEVRVVVARPITYEGVISAAFDQIRQNAGGHTAVYIRLLDALERVVARVSSESRLEPLLAQADLILARAAETVATAADRADVEARYRSLQRSADMRRERFHREPA